MNCFQFNQRHLLRFWITLGIIVCVSPGFVTAQPVVFNDPNLQVAVEEELRIANPNCSDMQSLTFLDASDSGITDLTGLECATNLQTLYLHVNRLSDISVLVNLTGLQELWLYSNQISDISVLANLTDLTVLVLTYNQISDISVLANLTGLTVLVLSDNQISDISVLANLTTMQRLYLSANPLNTPAYCQDIPQIWMNNSDLSFITYDFPNPNPLTVDCTFNLNELLLFNQQWIESNCNSFNNWCSGADLLHVGSVNMENFAEVSNLWLAP